MNLLREGLLTYPAQTPPGTCHLRLYSDGVRAVVIAGELSDNPGASVTNAWDSLAPVIYALLVRDLPTWADRGAASVTFVEYYPSDGFHPEGSFDLVSMAPGANPHLPWSRPRWTPSSRGYVENLLIGQPVQAWRAEDYRASAFTALD